MGFDEPVHRDPLFWIGVVVGFANGMILVFVRDLSGVSAVWSVITSTAGVTWLGAGVIGVLIRGAFRRRRDRNADIDLLLKDNGHLRETE